MQEIELRHGCVLTTGAFNLVPARQEDGETFTEKASLQVFVKNMNNIIEEFRVEMPPPLSVRTAKAISEQRKARALGRYLMYSGIALVDFMALIVWVVLCCAACRKT